MRIHSTSVSKIQKTKGTRLLFMEIPASLDLVTNAKTMQKPIWKYPSQKNPMIKESLVDHLRCSFGWKTTSFWEGLFSGDRLVLGCFGFILLFDMYIVLIPLKQIHSRIANPPKPLKGRPWNGPMAASTVHPRDRPDAPTCSWIRPTEVVASISKKPWAPLGNVEILKNSPNLTDHMGWKSAGIFKIHVYGKCSTGNNIRIFPMDPLGRNNDTPWVSFFFHPGWGKKQITVTS